MKLAIRKEKVLGFAIFMVLASLGLVLTPWGAWVLTTVISFIISRFVTRAFQKMSALEAIYQGWHVCHTTGHVLSRKGNLCGSNADVKHGFCERCLDITDRAIAKRTYKRARKRKNK